MDGAEEAAEVAIAEEAEAEMEEIGPFSNRVKGAERARCLFF